METTVAPSARTFFSTRWPMLALLLIVPVVAFLPVVQNGFVEWDDHALIVENPAIQKITPATVKTVFSAYDPELYIPLTFVSYQLDHLVGGLHPIVYHVHNLLLHLVNVLLVAWLLFALTKRRTAAVIGALLFAIHPLQVEAVVWASARKDLQSTLFFLLAILAYIRARGSKRPLFLALSIASFAVALLSKVTVLVLPLVLLLIDWREGRGTLRTRLWEKLAYVALSVLFAIIAVLGKESAVAATSLREVLLLSGKSLFFSLGKLFFPVGLSPLYPYTGGLSFAMPSLIVPLVFAVLLTLGAAWVGKRIHRDIAFGWFWFLLCVAPNLFLYRKGERLGDLYLTTDRYVYVAVIGLFLVAGLALAWLWRRDRLRWLWRTGIVALVALLASLSFLQTRVWHDTESLFFQVLRYYPNSHVAHLNIGNHYQREGDYVRAFDEYRTSVEIRPTSLAYFNIGNAQLTLKNYDAAVLANEEALKLDPTLAIAQLNLGVAYVRQQKVDEAIAAFQKLLTLEPDSVEGHFNLGVMYEEKQRWQDAVREYEEALLVQPTLLPALTRVMQIADSAGNRDIARFYAERVLTLQPGNAEARAILQKQ